MTKPVELLAARPPLAVVAVYERTIGASLERIWENVLDWEHLPWLHRTSFVDVRLREAFADGWRAHVALPPAHAPQDAEVHVRLERPSLRYLTRTLEGVGAGTEILTRLEPVDERTTRIAVEFAVPGVDPAHAEAVGAAYVRIYTQLWDEDEAMMLRRQRILDADAGRNRRAGARAAGTPIRLGRAVDVRSRLPVLVEASGEQYRVVEVDGALYAHATVCPHRGGPLADAPLTDGCVTCPWHGFRFDVRSGSNVNGRGCHLASLRVMVDPATTDVWLG
jgi:nitrite reductase/ring-hydroxylating ferredoxin subunit